MNLRLLFFAVNTILIWNLSSQAPTIDISSEHGQNNVGAVYQQNQTLTTTTEIPTRFDITNLNCLIAIKNDVKFTPRMRRSAGYGLWIIIEWIRNINVPC